MFLFRADCNDFVYMYCVAPAVTRVLSSRTTLCRQARGTEYLFLGRSGYELYIEYEKL